MIMQWVGALASTVLMQLGQGPHSTYAVGALLPQSHQGPLALHPNNLHEFSLKMRMAPRTACQLCESPPTPMNTRLLMGRPGLYLQ